MEIVPSDLAVIFEGMGEVGSKAFEGDLAVISDEELIDENLSRRRLRLRWDPKRSEGNRRVLGRYSEGTQRVLGKHSEGNQKGPEGKGTPGGK